MNFLLKIVEGPNKGAEIALVEGVPVTLGKGDDCDVVLADPTLPGEPLEVSATADGVSLGGEQVEQFAVKTLGATSFAVGPADAPWGELRWPKKEAAEPEGTTAEGRDERHEGDAPARDSSPGTEESSGDGKRRRGGCCGCLAALLALILVLAGLAWFFRDRLRESDRLEQFERIGRGWYSRIAGESGSAVQPAKEKDVSLADIAEKYGLLLVESNGTSCVSGNLRTRRERLAATAEAYQAMPGVELDVSDDESFRTAAEDALFTLSEGALKVAAATNRVLSIVGSSRSPLSLKKALDALNADIPKLAGVDVSGVVFGGVAAPAGEAADEVRDEGQAPSPVFRRAKKNAHSLPVCGILTAPYPCIVMRDGRRLMEGAAVGDSVIIEIGADSVTLTNSTGRFTWKP